MRRRLSRFAAGVKRQQRAAHASLIFALPIAGFAGTLATSAIATAQPMARLSRDFFARDVDMVGRALIGVVLLVGGVGGRIVETESYDGDDPASHAYLMRQTPRNAAMFGPPGHAYIYRSYGLHWMLNLVCLPGSAVLIRALEPLTGVETMMRRRGINQVRSLCAGPGRLCEALEITGQLNGASLLRPPFALSSGTEIAPIEAGTRIGLTKAVNRHRRFGLKGSRFLSKPFPSRE
jgi:DNA-3-methyladenine glycosylase